MDPLLAQPVPPPVKALGGAAINHDESPDDMLSPQMSPDNTTPQAVGASIVQNIDYPAQPMQPMAAAAGAHDQPLSASPGTALTLGIVIFGLLALIVGYVVVR